MSAMLLAVAAAALAYSRPSLLSLRKTRTDPVAVLASHPPVSLEVDSSQRASSLDSAWRAASAADPAVPSPPAVRLDYGELRGRVGDQDFALLRGVSPSVSQAGAAAGVPADPSVTFFSFAVHASRSDHIVPLGALQCKRFLAGARTKRWWMGPTFGNQGSDVPTETQARATQPVLEVTCLLSTAIAAPTASSSISPCAAPAAC